jgi:HTH-type transcriptional regulator/antitoxin HigA
MSLDDNKYNEIDALLSGAFMQESLREMFTKRVHELKTNQTAVLKFLKIERKTLNGILDGTQKRANFSNLHRLALFLNVSTETLIQMQVEIMEKNVLQKETPAGKKKYLRDHFDPGVLKKSGFIKNLDLEELEKKLLSFLSIDSIFDYQKKSFDIALSEAAVLPTSTESILSRNLSRDFWFTCAQQVGQKLNNQYPYNRQKLIEYFPQIRWNCTNVEFGMINVIKALFKLGVTVIYQPPFSSLHLSGATFNVNNKPFIVLTDYKGFYSTLWHCLLHELYHVLFDWEEIRVNLYHASENESESLTIDEKEVEANSFAREYFFPAAKSHEIYDFLRDKEYVNQYAKSNNLHPSIIYAYYAFDNNSVDRMAWARARSNNADIKKSVYRLENDWSDPMPIDEYVKKIKLEIYN